MALILLAEDDEGIRTPLVRALEREGHEVHTAATGPDAIAAGVDGAHDLLVLDIGLPGADGLEVCRRVRERRPTVPIVFLTAQDERGRRRRRTGRGRRRLHHQALPPGRAPRPRARAAAPHAAPSGSGPARSCVDVAARRASIGGDELELSPKEFDLLALLVREAGRVVTRERIMAEVWDENWFGSTKTLDMHVSWLRRKLGDEADNPRHLVTVRGVGLRFEG